MAKQRVSLGGGSVKIHEGRGIMTDAGKLLGVGGHGPGGKRGKIKSWTFASRRRFREFMLTNRPVDGHGVYDVTLTIPGDVVEVPEMKAIWQRWKMAVVRGEMSCIWRLEVQQRGQPHWHCLMGCPESVPLKMGKMVFQERCVPWIVSTWLRCLGLERSCRIGAMAHSVHIKSGDEGNARWLRYMADHASKGKQAQMADGFGKHWGVIGRAFLIPARPILEMELPRRTWSILLRLLRRRGRRSIPADCVFGYRLAWKARRGNWGRSVWFGDEAESRRLVEAAIRIATPSLLPTYGARDRQA